MGPDDVEPWKLAACPLRPRLWGHVRPHCSARWTQNHSGPGSPVISGQNGEPLTLRKWSPGCLVCSKMGNPEPFSSRCWVVLLDLLVENGVLCARPKNNTRNTPCSAENGRVFLERTRKAGGSSYREGFLQVVRLKCLAMWCDLFVLWIKHEIADLLFLLLLELGFSLLVSPSSFCFCCFFSFSSVLFSYLLLFFSSSFVLILSSPLPMSSCLWQTAAPHSLS